MKIPVLINNRDLLHSVVDLVDYFLTVPDVEILLADNASTYPPLLEWYETKCPVKVHHLGENVGPRGATRLLSGRTDPFFFTVDSDLDFSLVPTNFMATLMRGLEKFPVPGAGLGWKIDDVPSTYDVSSEPQYHSHILDDDFFLAQCDTGGVLRPRSWNGSYDGIRARHLEVRHLPWYHDDKNRPEDFEYYIQHCNPAGLFFTSREIDQRKKRS